MIDELPFGSRRGVCVGFGKRALRMVCPVPYFAMILAQNSFHFLTHQARNVSG
jgi:hypothetical protein